MEPFLQEVRDGEGIIPEYWAQGTGGNAGDTYFMSQYWGIDPLDDAVGVVGIRAADANLQVLLTPEEPEYAQAMTLTYRLVEDGLIPRDLLPAEEAKAAVRAGKFIYMHHVEKPGNEAELMSSFGHEWVIKNLTDPLILDTAGATATLNGIGASCPNPDNAMLVLEMLNTNVEVYTLICRGIEGKHWVWVDKEQNLAGFPEGVTGETSGYNPNTDWMFGNQFNAPYRDPVQVGAWPKTKEMNDTATPSKALGFTFDRTPVQNEIAQVTAVKAEYGMPINDGHVDPATAIPQYVEQLKAAGVQTIVDEMQRQLNDWKAAKA
jgi:putative aldouronate transport system substrate-binding protein